MSRNNDENLRRIKDLTIELKALKIRKNNIEEEINQLAALVSEDDNSNERNEEERSTPLSRSKYYSDRDGELLHVGDTVLILTKGRSAKTNTRAVVTGLDRGSYIVLKGSDGKEIIRYPRNVRVIEKVKQSQNDN